MDITIEKAGSGSDDNAPSEMELKSMAETLQEAAEIKADPELMKLLKPYLSKKVKSLQDLKDLAKEKSENESPDEEASESPEYEKSEGDVE